MDSYNSTEIITIIRHNNKFNFMSDTSTLKLQTLANLAIYRH